MNYFKSAVAAIIGVFLGLFAARSVANAELPPPDHWDYQCTEVRNNECDYYLEPRDGEMWAVFYCAPSYTSNWCMITC